MLWLITRLSLFLRARFCFTFVENAQASLFSWMDSSPFLESFCDSLPMVKMITTSSWEIFFLKKAFRTWIDKNGAFCSIWVMHVVSRPVLRVAFRKQESSPNAGYRGAFWGPKIRIWDFNTTFTPFWETLPQNGNFQLPKQGLLFLQVESRRSFEVFLPTINNIKRACLNDCRFAGFIKW